jgi:hypothetical protein
MRCGRTLERPKKGLDQRSERHRLPGGAALEGRDHDEHFRVSALPRDHREGRRQSGLLRGNEVIAVPELVDDDVSRGDGVGETVPGAPGTVGRLLGTCRDPRGAPAPCRRPTLRRGAFRG